VNPETVIANARLPHVSRNGEWWAVSDGLDGTATWRGISSRARRKKSYPPTARRESTPALMNGAAGAIVGFVEAGAALHFKGALTVSDLPETEADVFDVQSL
jgi:hypothetical protein